MSHEGVTNPAAPPQSPNFPENPIILVFEQFATLNTKPPRPGIKDQEMSWCDGFMPFGPNNLRTLYGVGSALYTASGTTIELFGFGNIGTTPYCIVFLADGSVVAVNTDTGSTTTILPAGTIQNPSTTTTGMNQWSSTYILIVSKQTNGYWVWDGTALYTTGTLGPIVTVTNGGSGYTNPSISFSGGSGSGATATASVSGGVITEITITSGGSGYSPGDSVTVVITDPTGTGAAATVTLMPSGVSGTAVETYTGHVWIINGPRVQFSAPGSVSDFATSSGGGSFTSVDSFLNIGFTQIKQSNGFLYLIADSAINYISGVSTSGTPSTTTFNVQNVDPQIGSPWPASLQPFSRNLVFGNSLGIYVSYGGAVQKISEPLDGFYTSVSNFGGMTPSGAVANIFGVEVFMQLTQVIDTYTSQQVNKLLMWSGQRWFTSQQDVSLVFIASQKINSVLTAWGTDGSAIWPLFQQPSTGITKVAQSKLWSNPSYLYTKVAGNLYGVIDYFQNDGQPVNIIIDNELTGTSYTAPAASNAVSWINQSGDAVNWINASAAPVTWIVAGITVFGPVAVSQQGAMIGMTVTTDASDIAFLSATLLNQSRQANI